MTRHAREPVLAAHDAVTHVGSDHTQAATSREVGPQHD